MKIKEGKSHGMGDYKDIKHCGGNKSFINFPH